MSLKTIYRGEHLVCARESKRGNQRERRLERRAANLSARCGSGQVSAASTLVTARWTQGGGRPSGACSRRRVGNCGVLAVRTAAYPARHSQSAASRRLSSLTISLRRGNVFRPRTMPPNLLLRNVHN